MSELYLTPEGPPGPFPIAEVVRLESWSTRQSLPRIVFFDGPPPTLTDTWTRVSPLGGVDIEVRAPDLYRLATPTLVAALDAVPEGTRVTLVRDDGETFDLVRVGGDGWAVPEDVVLVTADITEDVRPVAVYSEQARIWP